MTRLELREASVPVDVALPNEVALALVDLRICQVAPAPGGVWRISGVSSVGVFRVGEWTVAIEPKTSIRSLFFLVSLARHWRWWRDEDVRIDSIDEFFDLIAVAFVRLGIRTLNGGVHQGYVTLEESATIIRGRLRVAEQIRRRMGMPLPAELLVDDFTVDVPENQILRSAARRLLRIETLPSAVRAGTHRVDRILADVSTLPRGSQLPVIHFDRRNARYREALDLAMLILVNAGIRESAGSVVASGFLLPMADVFEQFIAATLGEALERRGGTVSKYATHLDLDERISVVPDLVWTRAGAPAAVMDAKYKAEKPSGFPNVDIYQMAAYCGRLGLDVGHLIYAAGNEPEAVHRLHAGVTVHCHALDLDAEPAELLRQVEEIAELIARGARYLP